MYFALMASLLMGCIVLCRIEDFGSQGANKLRRDIEQRIRLVSPRPNIQTPKRLFLAKISVTYKNRARFCTTKSHQHHHSQNSQTKLTAPRPKHPDPSLPSNHHHLPHAVTEREPFVSGMHVKSRFLALARRIASPHPRLFTKPQRRCRGISPLRWDLYTSCG